MPNLAAFISFILITTFTPGPNNIMAMSNASRYGFRKSLAFNRGVMTGFFVVFGLCSYFSAALMEALPSFKLAMTYIGAAYILWLAYKVYRSKPHRENETKNTTNTFLMGFALQFVNPKLILYSITLVSTFILPYYNGFWTLAGFAVLLSIIAFLSLGCWALFGSFFQVYLEKHAKAVNAIMALLLVYCAVSLFV